MRFSIHAVLIPLVLFCFGCQQPAETPSTSTAEIATTSKAANNVFEITIEGLTFSAPDEIPSGWVTFQMTNASPMTHFGLVERLPEGHGIEEQQQLVAPVFQQGMDLLNKGDNEGAHEKFGELPEWFGDIVFIGGPGMAAPATTIQATMYLSPGDYLLECYVKTGGIFHSYNPAPDQYGMVHQFTVTDAASDAPEPTATVELNISSEKGIESPETLDAGEQTVAVHFVDQIAHENFVGHDVHLALLTDDTDLDTLEGWMNWASPAGLETPAPVKFVGGINEMPAGETGYFTVTLEPGHYAWISEVPASKSKGMLKTFEVTGSE